MWQTEQDLRNAPELLKAWRERSREAAPIKAINESRVTDMPREYHVVSLALPDTNHTVREMSTNPIIPISFGEEIPSIDRPGGAQREGLFDDTLTRNLLGLQEDHRLSIAGTYGVRDWGLQAFHPATSPSRTYDQRLVPFVLNGGDANYLLEGLILCPGDRHD